MGAVFGKIIVTALILDMLLNKILEWWRPSSKIDICPDPYRIAAHSVNDSQSSALLSTGTTKTDLLMTSNDVSSVSESYSKSTNTPRRSARLKNRTYQH